MSGTHLCGFNLDFGDWTCTLDGCDFRTKDSALAYAHDMSGASPSGEFDGLKLSLETAITKAQHEGAAIALDGLLPLLYKELNGAEKTFTKDKRDVSQTEHARACAIQTLMLDVIEEVKSRRDQAQHWPSLPPGQDVL